MKKWPTASKMTMNTDRLGNPDIGDVHNEDIVDIIGTPPSSIVRWGTTWVIVILGSIIGLSSFIRYPDVIKAPVRISTINAPKAVITPKSGRLVNILIKDGDSVAKGESLAWIESTADHGEVETLRERLIRLRDSLLLRSTHKYSLVDAPKVFQLGELQSSYQAFYQSYLAYRSAVGGGIYLKQREYLLEEVRNIDKHGTQLNRQLELQKREYAIVEKEFERYRVLVEKKVISPSEFQRQQALLLAEQHPIEQIEASILVNNTSRSIKMKEIAELDHQIEEEKSKFMQAMNSLISEIDQWKMQHVLIAPQRGIVVYSRIIQQGQYMEAGQEIFYVNSGSTKFFGEVNIPQYNMGKVKVGQDVLVKLESYPFEEYGMLQGTVGYLNRVSYRDSTFLSRIDIKSSPVQVAIHLTTGMTGTAEIITEDASLLQRLMRNVYKVAESSR